MPPYSQAPNPLKHTHSKGLNVRAISIKAAIFHYGEQIGYGSQRWLYKNLFNLFTRAIIPSRHVFGAAVARRYAPHICRAAAQDLDLTTIAVAPKLERDRCAGYARYGGCCA